MIAFNSRVWFLMYILFLVFLSLPMFFKCFLVLWQFEPHVSYTHVSYIKKNVYMNAPAHPHPPAPKAFALKIVIVAKKNFSTSLLLFYFLLLIYFPLRIRIYYHPYIPYNSIIVNNYQYCVQLLFQ